MEIFKFSVAFMFFFGGRKLIATHDKLVRVKLWMCYKRVNMSFCMCLQLWQQL